MTVNEMLTRLHQFQEEGKGEYPITYYMDKGWEDAYYYVSPASSYREREWEGEPGQYSIVFELE